jgi:exodeoxyribonuclease-5
MNDNFGQFESYSSVVICATNRLVRNLRTTFGMSQVGSGTTIWKTPDATTIDAWLSSLGDQISLMGETSVDQIPNRVLTPFQEGHIWKQSIEATHGEDSSLLLFDLHSLARTASEAHALINTWKLPIENGTESEETQQFVRWRESYTETCQSNGWVDVIGYQKRIIKWLESGAGTLPKQVVFAGFDSFSPHLKLLQEVLVRRGVEISTLESSISLCSNIRAIACDDAEAECRAAGAWAQKMLESMPDAHIGIVVADLEARRSIITPILDEALNPTALVNLDDSPPQLYNVSLGLPLTHYGMARTGLTLLRLLGSPQGLALTEFGNFLRMPYWSADQSEADLRAQVDAKLRERSGQNLVISTVLRVLKSAGGIDSKLFNHLSQLGDSQQKYLKSRLPSDWAGEFRQALHQVGWPGERKLTSAEFQTRAAFLETLDMLADLDAFLGSIDIMLATNEFARLCGEKIFQPKTVGQPAVQVLGLLEAKGAEFDALWVMGMNDQHWPPPARPNPLLPAEMQRQHRTPGASAEVQTEFAQAIHKRLLHSAPNVTFSYAEKDGERELRASPLIEGVALDTDSSSSDILLPSTIFHHLDSEVHAGVTFEHLDDHLAPPLADGEKVSGGSGLLKAQAICPAWAFYRYRLGAKKLETPTEGLDASRRGTMVHSMLEAFWKSVRDSSALQAMTGEQLQTAIAHAVEVALRVFETGMGEPLAQTFRQLEAHRLHRLCLQWLAIERPNPETMEGRADFKVVACEEKHTVDLGHLRINLVIDRIDELTHDGRRVVLDYKTGSKVDAASWHKERLTEPQLPLYAAIVLANSDQPPVAAVAFAKVRLGECKFAGVAAESGLLPGVGGMSPSTADSDETDELEVDDGTAPDVSQMSNSEDANAESECDSEVSDWQHLLNEWKVKLEAIAEEIHNGEAAVRFEDVKDLVYCDVLPLLRVSERQQQFEQQEARP